MGISESARNAKNRIQKKLVLKDQNIIENMKNSGPVCRIEYRPELNIHKQIAAKKDTLRRRRNGRIPTLIGVLLLLFLTTLYGTERLKSNSALFAALLPMRIILIMIGRLTLCGFAQSTIKKHML